MLKVSKNKVKVVEVNGEKVSPPTAKKNQAMIPPALTEVVSYFAEQNSSETEANKFYNYFQSNGWKIGGKAPMRDWQAAARNWMLNIPQFSPQPQVSAQKQPVPDNLNTVADKNYSEPL